MKHIWEQCLVAFISLCYIKLCSDWTIDKHKPHIWFWADHSGCTASLWWGSGPFPNQTFHLTDKHTLGALQQILSSNISFPPSCCGEGSGADRSPTLHERLRDDEARFGKSGRDLFPCGPLRLTNPFGSIWGRFQIFFSSRHEKQELTSKIFRYNSNKSLVVCQRARHAALYNSTAAADDFTHDFTFCSFHLLLLVIVQIIVAVDIIVAKVN